MVAKTETDAMAEKIAVAIFMVTLDHPDETAWDDLDEETQSAFMAGAHAAIKTNAEWLAQNGWRVLPPGTVQVPTSSEEAQAMLTAVSQFQAKTAQIPARKIIGLDGKPL